MTIQPLRFFLYLVAVLAVGVVVGLSLAGSGARTTGTKTEYVTEYITVEAGTETPVIPEVDLPLPREFLLSPVFYQWTARADGTLVNKTENSMTLEKDGKPIVIGVGPQARFFFQEQGTSSPPPTPLTFEDITIGAKLRGTVFLLDQQNNSVGAGEKIIGAATVFTVYSDGR